MLTKQKCRAPKLRKYQLPYFILEHGGRVCWIQALGKYVTAHWVYIFQGCQFLRSPSLFHVSDNISEKNPKAFYFAVNSNLRLNDPDT